MESLKQYEMDDIDEVPPWAETFFGKMKEEICAEVHAKVSYSMRLMLDQLREDVRSSFEQFDAQKISKEECFCQELNKCKKKLDALCTSHQAVLKEERKHTKRELQETKKRNKFFGTSTDSDTDDENCIEASFSPTVSQKSNGIKYDLTKTPPVPPRKSSPAVISSSLDVGSVSPNKQITECIKEPKLLNGPVLESPAAKEHAIQSEVIKTFQDKSSVSLGATSTSNLLDMTDKKFQSKENLVVETQLSPSDSEFEVISMPPNIKPVVSSEYARLQGETSPLISDYEDSSNDECDTETGYEFKDCKQISTEQTSSPQPSGSLYPELELKKMSLSMISSTSTALDGYMSTSSNEGAVALEPAVPIERQRAPYSVSSDEVEQINQQEIVHNEPLPSEFLRDRKPYSHVPVGEEQQVSQEIPAQQPQPQPRPSVNNTPTNARPHQNRDSTYRVDNLPESLWDEALTVAAQTYNAAKAAVGNLADTFVPGVDKGLGSASRSSVRVEPTRRTSSSAGSTTGVLPQTRDSPVRSQPTGMSPKEQKLNEMGFLDRALNATLLIRHNGDMDRVIAELIEP